jgi:hypothetical protein
LDYDPADPVNPYISMEPSSGAWPQITRITGTNVYNVADLGNHTTKYSDRITIFTGRFASWTEHECDSDADAKDGIWCSADYGASCHNSCPSGEFFVRRSTFYTSGTDCRCKVICANNIIARRYDLNNFFFVNLGTKSYSTSTEKTDVIKNKHIATLEKSGNTWLAFCGDGKLEVTVTPTVPTSGTIFYKNPANADQSKTVTNLSDVDYTISPTTHLYEVQGGDGTYKVTLTLNNVQISDPRMVDTTPVVRYAHQKLLTDEVKNVRIVDLAYSDGDKPRKYGNVIFGSDTSGTLKSKTYEIFEHLKYWVTSANDNHLYYTDGVPGDYFIQLMDYNDNIPTITWFFPNEVSSGNEKSGYGNGLYGTYSGKYSFSGLHRVFFPYGEQEYHGSYGARLDLISSGNNQKMVLVMGGFTSPINNAMLTNGYQAGAGTNEVDPPSDATNTPAASVARVTAAACAKLAAAGGSNTMVYVIKYGSGAPTTLDSCGPSGKIKIYSATSEAALNDALQHIANSIKSFTPLEDALIKEANP